MEAAFEIGKPPKCIFIPDRKLARQMILAVIKKSPNLPDDIFLLKFALVKNPNKAMAVMSMKI